MYSEFQLPPLTESAPEEFSVPAPSGDDPLQEVRDLRKHVRTAVYAAILLALVFDAFVLGFNQLQLAVIALFSVLISAGSVEGAFLQAFKLRKQSAYPRDIIVQLSDANSSALAHQRGLAVIIRLLRLDGAFLCLLQHGSLSLVALNGLNRLQADHFLRTGAANIEQAVDTASAVPYRPHSAMLSEALLPSGARLVFVPVRSIHGTGGVLGLLAGRSNRDIADARLLNVIAFALGVSLENLHQTEDLRALAAMDELTGVYNRRYFFEEVNREMAFASRYKSPLAVAILDLDGLKAINDNLGHAAGDEVLRTVAMRLVRYSRASDLVARIGGDEFALILPRTNSRGAQDIAARLQYAVELDPVAFADGQDAHVAISYGIASYPEDADDIYSLIRRADAVMYCAKAARRQPTDA